jgi:hypothetical protein
MASRPSPARPPLGKWRPRHNSSSTSAPASGHGIQVPCVSFLGSSPFHSTPWTQVFLLPMVEPPSVATEL